MVDGADVTVEAATAEAVEMIKQVELKLEHFIKAAAARATTCGKE